MSLRKNYISSASAQSLGRVCSMGANFVVFVLAARWLGADLFGQYSYILVFLGLAIMIAEFGTTSVLATDIARVKEDASSYWGNFLFLRLTITLAVMAIAVPCAWFARPDLFPSLFLGLMGLFFLGSRFFDPLYQVFDRPWYSFYGSVLYSAIFAIFSIAMLYYRRPLFELIGVYVVANILYTFYAAYLSYSLVRPSFRLRWSIQKPILTLAFPVGLSGIFTLIHTRADTFMLAAMKGDYAVGIYNSAYRFLDMAVIFAVMLSSPLVPILSKLAQSDRMSMGRKYDQILQLLTMVIMPVALSVPIISPLFVDLVFGQDYAEVAPLLNLMAWIGVLSFYSLFNFVALLAVKVVNFQIWLGAITALLNVILNYFLIPQYSFFGSAWATLLVECIFVLVSFLYVIKSVGNNYSLQVWFQIGLMNLFLLLTVLFTGGLNIPLRLVMVVTVWVGSLFVFNISLKQLLAK